MGKGLYPHMFWKCSVAPCWAGVFLQDFSGPLMCWYELWVLKKCPKSFDHKALYFSKKEHSQANAVLEPWASNLKLTLLIFLPKNTSRMPLIGYLWDQRYQSCLRTLTNETAEKKCWLPLSFIKKKLIALLNLFFREPSEKIPPKHKVQNCTYFLPFCF